MQEVYRRDGLPYHTLKKDKYYIIQGVRGKIVGNWESTSHREL